MILKYQSTKQALEALQQLQETLAAYNHVMGVTYLDASTAAPKGSYEGRGKAMGILSRVTYDLTANPENDEMLSVLEADMESLTPQQKREVEVLRKNFNQLKRIPADEYVEYTVLLNDAEAKWEQAKNDNDFDLFAPYLEKIVDFNMKFAGYYNPDIAPYDALLNEYEEGLTMETLDKFFSQLRSAIVPLLEKIVKAEPIDNSFLFKPYPIEKQKELAAYLMQVLDMDRNYCAISESEHPFTSGFNNKDVRITTHYYEDAPTFAMYSTIHEGGHAIYEMDCDDCYNYTVLSGGASMGIHESQSRFYENLIGRSKAFTHFLFPKLKELFPEQLEGVDAEQFYRAVNKVEPSLIRTEADELTYCLHIMVRYEIEKQLISGKLKVKDVPATWNKLYKEYLGIDVPDDTNGCLQDVHWAGGSIGYFPSYALGSAYGPQMLACMEKEVGDIYGDIAKGDLSKPRNWLKENIHRYSALYKPAELFERVCGKFDAKYFTDYLTKKFSELYGI
jgi:carboxypeptidase Taq